MNWLEAKKSVNYAPTLQSFISTMKKVFLSAALLCTAAIGTSIAQQRLVLVEHFTQASCGPCASQNPALNAILDANTDKVVAIKYQTSWPGVDPMNAANPTEVAARVNYYGVNAVPNSVMDGNFYNGAPSGVTATRINQRYNAPSPINLQVKYYFVENSSAISDSMLVVAKIAALQPLASGHVLHLAAIEREIQFITAPGSNGEKKFESVMKKMLPNASGTPLPAMNIGDSIVVSHKFALLRDNGTNVYYDLGQAAVVGFVQNVSTKSVLQAGYDEPRPWLSVSIPNGTKPVKVKADDEIEYSLTTTSKSNQDQLIKIVPSINGLPSGWTATIIADGNTYVGEAIIPLLANSTKDIQVKVIGENAGVENKKVTVKVDINSEFTMKRFKYSQNYTVISPSNILYMDLPGTATTRFTPSLTAAGQAYVYLGPDETPNLDPTGLTAAVVKKIYYSTGAAYSGTITASLAAAFTSYLNSGGNLFIMGQDIGYELAPGGTPEALEFYEQYLGASYIADGVTTAVGVSPYETDELLAPHFSGGFTIAANSASYPDQVALNENPLGTPGSFLYYSSGNGDADAAIYNFNDNWKTIYVAFRMEGVPTTGTGPAFRNKLILVTNNWFDGILTTNEMVQTMNLGSAYPNPAKNLLSIPVSKGKGSVTLTSVNGQTVKSMELNGTQGDKIQMSLESVPSGMYFLKTQVGGAPVSTQKIVVQ